MRRATLTTSLYLVLLFLSGVAVGAFGLQLYRNSSVRANNTHPTPEEFRRRYVAELRQRLKLTEDQVNLLGPILDETRQRHRLAFEKHKPEMKAIQEDQVQKIRAILTATQQPEYTKFLEERERQRPHDAP
jgi:hypothetical protein